jgi:hypothetical protein
VKSHLKSQTTLKILHKLNNTFFEFIHNASRNVIAVFPCAACRLKYMSLCLFSNRERPWRILRNFSEVQKSKSFKTLTISFSFPGCGAAWLHFCLFTPFTSEHFLRLSTLTIAEPFLPHHVMFYLVKLSVMKLQGIVRERDEDQRFDFIRRIAQYDPEELGFIDEVSRDERSIGRHYGWSKRGRQAKMQQPFVQGRRTSSVGVLTLDGFVAGTAVEGSLTKDVMLEWLEFDVVGSSPASTLLTQPTTS